MPDVLAAMTSIRQSRLAQAPTYGFERLTASACHVESWTSFLQRSNTDH